MSYLKEEDVIEIADNVRLLSIEEIEDVSHYLFDSHIEEYNTFLEIAKKLGEKDMARFY